VSSVLSGSSVTDLCNRSEARLKFWDLMSTAWKGAYTILVLRFLYFGRPELAPPTEVSPSGSPTSMFIRSATGASYQDSEGPSLAGSPDSLDDLPDFLDTDAIFKDLLSEPLPSVEHDVSTSNLWPSRYEIHNGAFSALFTSFFTMHDTLDPSCLRYLLVPLLILALVSQPNSPERALCLSYFAKYKEFMKTNYPPDTATLAGSSPLGGQQLDLDISWEKLDAFSEAATYLSGNVQSSTDGGLAQGAPEWNWYDMLDHLKLSFVCKSPFPFHRSFSYLFRNSSLAQFAGASRQRLKEQLLRPFSVQSTGALNSMGSL
jgi:hypothetical protein